MILKVFYNLNDSMVLWFEGDSLKITMLIQNKKNQNQPKTPQKSRYTE